jgi:hypothetical protein
MSTNTEPSRPLDPIRKFLRKRRNRVALYAAVGSLAGLACKFLAEPYQGGCHVAAKLLGLVFGAG